MGCDLHAVVYAQTWAPAYAEVLAFSEPRDYRLFSAMANVRNYYGIAPIAEPRGFPSWCRASISESLGEPSAYVNADIGFGDHSYSWLTTDEFAEAIKRAQDHAPHMPVDVAYHAVLAAMRTLDRPGAPAMLVFGFDN